MPTRSGFIRPSDPINAVQMASDISTALSKTVTVEVSATDVLVTGTTISSSDDVAIQAAITASYYKFFQYGAPLTDNPDMSSDRHDKGITEHAAYMADSAVLAAAQRKAWVTGVLKPNAFIYFAKATTSSGSVTFYLTDDGTSTGNAVFTNVYADSITISPYGSSAVYQISAPTVAANKKSVTAIVNQVTSVLVGLLQVTAAANAVQCNMLVLGD